MFVLLFIFVEIFKTYIMKRKNNNYVPIYYKSKEELDIPMHKLIEALRNDICKVRGKLFDIKKTYGWDSRIEYLEGGLTCMLVAMYDTSEEARNFEAKQQTTK